MEPRVVVAIRAYEWSNDIAALAARMFANCPGAHHVILMNEAKGPVDCQPFEKLVHTEDFSAYGLPERPAGQSLWYNGDYAYIWLRDRLPDFDYYIVTESDVALNASLGPMIATVHAEGIDAVMHGLQPVDRNWYWHDAAQAQPDPWSAGLFLGLFSARAMDTIRAARLDLARQLDSGTITRWPIIESLVPTSLRAAGMRLAELRRFVGVDLLRYRPVLAVNDPRTRRPRTILHPVCGGAMLVRKFMDEGLGDDMFVPRSAFATALSHEELAPLAPLLFAGLIRQGDHRRVRDLHELLAGRGVAFPHHADLAHGKPSLISSASRWSRGQDPELDAAGANGVVIHAECAFHTENQTEAWWMVDLLEPCAIDRICIVNRGDLPERFVQFAIDVSDDGVMWQESYRKSDDLPVSGDIDRPWTLDLTAPVVARYVRVRRLGPPDCLHLRRVQLFGRPTGH